MMQFDPGELDQVIEHWRDVLTDDGYGGQENTPTKLGDRWAKVVPIKGDERVQSDRLNRVSTYVFTVRSDHLESILETDFVIWKNRKYNVRFVPDLKLQHQFISFEAESGVAN